jgi:hypothetical protein
MIVQGTPTQAAEDQLRKLEQTLSRLKDQRQRIRASEVHRKNARSSTQMTAATR